MHRADQSRMDRGRRLVVACLGAALAFGACQAMPTSPATPGSATPAPSPTAGRVTPGTSPTAPSTPAATAPASPAATAALERLSVTAEPFSRVTGSALSMTAPDDGTGRLFVGNQDGQIWVISRDGSVEKEPLVDLEARIRSGGEQGLLAIAVHPAFPTDPRVFVDFTDRNGDTVIASLTLDPGNPNRLDPATFKQLLLIDQPFPNHNGGELKFGPDGYLTISLGDGGSGGDPLGNGQNRDALLGKVLRIDVDGTSSAVPYAIPQENPFLAGGGHPEVWLLGLRNPWRTSFDRTTGDFWIGDVGQGEWEEVDVVRAGTAGQVNFGWNVTEGPDCYEATTCKRAGLTGPVASYGHDLGCAVVGGFVYRGSAYPLLVGTYLFSDNCSRRIFAIDAASDGPSVPVQIGRAEASVSSFGEDERGELYVLTLEGFVLKVVATQS